jgi:hypothetical protein
LHDIEFLKIICYRENISCFKNSMIEFEKKFSAQGCAELSYQIWGVSSICGLSWKAIKLSWFHQFTDAIELKWLPTIIMNNSFLWGEIFSRIDYAFAEFQFHSILLNKFHLFYFSQFISLIKNDVSQGLIMKIVLTRQSALQWTAKIYNKFDTLEPVNCKKITWPDPLEYIAQTWT